MHGRDELLLGITISRDGIDLQRTGARVFVIGHGAVSVVVVVPFILGVLLDLDDDILLVNAIDLDLLAQLHFVIVGAQVDADDLPLLGLLVLQDVLVIVQGGPSFSVHRTELNGFLSVELFLFLCQRRYIPHAFLIVE